MFNQSRIRSLDPLVELIIIRAHKLIFSPYPVFATPHNDHFFCVR